MAGPAENQMRWAPIDGLDDDDLTIDISEFTSMARVWLDARGTVEQQGALALEHFYARLRRAWSIETGILEGLYTLDRGTTLTLIDQGFQEELIDPNDTDIDTGRLLRLLQDHLAASEMLQALITDQRPVTPHFIRQLQALLTRNQLSVEAQDTSGQRQSVEPLRGEWKRLPNWRTLPDGSRHYYCPPEQTEPQIEELFICLKLYEDDNVNVAILAAWLHHRFTSIHPFQDGNGRVARALVNYLFVKSGLFPLVVHRDEKLDYIDALEVADNGDLSRLVQLFSRRQVEAIKQALSLQVEQPPAALVTEVARGVVDRMRRRREQERDQLRGVNYVIERLWNFATENLQRQLNEFAAELREGGVEAVVHVDSGGSHDGRDYYYRRQIIESAQQVHQWANFTEDSRWVRALVRGGTSQLRFLLSYHHIGRSLTGAAEVTAIADLEDRKGDTDEPMEREALDVRTPVHCMLQPFSVTWRDEAEGLLLVRFEDWIRETLVIALRSWADTV